MQPRQPVAHQPRTLLLAARLRRGTRIASSAPHAHRPCHHICTASRPALLCSLCSDPITASDADHGLAKFKNLMSEKEPRFNISSEFSQKILQKYRKLLKEEQGKQVRASAADAATLAPYRDSVGADPDAGSDAEDDSMAASLDQVLPTLDATGDLRIPRVHRPRVHSSVVHIKEPAGSADSGGLDATGLTASLPGDSMGASADADAPAGALSPELDESLLDAVKGEQAAVIAAIKRRAQDQVAYAEKERDYTLAHARKTSLEALARAEQLEARLRKKDAAIQGMQADLAQVKALYETRQQALFDRIGGLEADKQALARELAEWRARVGQTREAERLAFKQRLRVAADAARARAAGLEHRVRLLEQTNRELEQEKVLFLRETTADIGSLNKCHEDAKETLVGLTLSNKKLRQRLVVLATERDTLHEENTSLRGELEGLRDRNENLTRELIRADRVLYGRPRASPLRK